MSITDSHEQTAQRACDAVIRAAEGARACEAHDHDTWKGWEQRADDCRSDGVRVLTAALALERAYGALEGWDKSGWPHEYSLGIHARNCRACIERKQRLAIYNACRAAVEEAG